MVKAMKHAKYFEAILQLRDVEPSFIDKILDQIERSSKVEIARVKDCRNGVDIYLSDQRFARAFGKTMNERFGGELKMSRKLHSRDRITGKMRYRVTVLFRKLPFKKGDIVKMPEGAVKVLKIANQVQVKYIDSGKKEFLRFDALARFVR